jgi:hypothetical protein
MPYSAIAKNYMLDQLASQATYASLHTSSPGSTGANEVTGGTPAYARKALTWDAASGGSMSLHSGSTPTFDVPAATTITHVGIWSAATAGTYYGYVDVTDETFAAQGTYQITSGTFDLNATTSA